jgi:hypothetical protein
MNSMTIPQITGDLSCKTRHLGEILRVRIAKNFGAGGVKPGMGVKRLMNATMLQAAAPRPRRTRGLRRPFLP